VTLDKKKSFGFLVTELIVSKVFYYFYVLVIPMLVLPVAWWMVVIFYLCMHLITGFILTIIFQTAHVMPTSQYPLPDESGSVENNWTIHQLLTTSDYSPRSRLFSWFIGGLNYQVEHHLFPAICHVHYKKLSLVVKETAQKYNLPYHVQDTFFQAIANHFKMLRVLGR
jgi:linoleoyl-CoA desaturase